MNLTTWSELVAAATVGTDRQPDVAPGELLDRAAAAAAYRRAGVLPARQLTRPPFAAEETGPVAAGVAAVRLALLLGVGPGTASWSGDSQLRATLLREWLTRAAGRGLRVPPELLPALLDAGRRTPDLHGLIPAVGGYRVRWLAAQRPDWAYLAGADDDPGTWTDGTLERRLGYLVSLRRRDPGAARELLAADWPGLPPDERARLLPALADGLGPGDEPLLEDALDDRRAEVRAVAADLLVRLPGSAYADRMLARARSYLRVGDGPVEVHPPEECDAAMRRDGVRAAAARGSGERAWWLTEVLARTPLSRLDPALRTVPVPPEWFVTVLGGLARAALAQRDAQWAAPLLAAALAAGSSDAEVLAGLAELAPQPMFDRAIEALRTEREPGRQLAALRLCPGPWPARLDRAVLGALAQLAASPELRRFTDAYCQLAVYRMAPAMAPAVAGLAATVASTGRPLPQLDRLADALQFRADLAEELA